MLGEQRLQSSGAVDSAKAAELGKILGAETLLLGNLTRVDGTYQVNARLVIVETGEVLVSGYAELGIDAFEDDAKVYLNLVPQEQTLGIYAVMNYRYNNNSIPAFTETVGNVTTNFYPRSFSSVFAGGGLLYRPLKNLQINSEIISSQFGKESYVRKVECVGSVCSTQRAPLKMVSISLGAAYVLELGGNWRGNAGLGLQTIYTSVTPKKENPPAGLFVRTGVEYKPQSRVGFGLNLKYELNRVVVRSANTNYVLVKLNPFSTEFTMALYF